MTAAEYFSEKREGIERGRPLRVSNLAIKQREVDRAELGVLEAAEAWAAANDGDVPVQEMEAADDRLLLAVRRWREAVGVTEVKQ